MTETLVLPITGEVVDLDAPLETFVAAWDQLADFERDLKLVKREISDEITRRLDHEGRRSMSVGGVKFTTTPPTEKVWDLKELADVLSDLVDEQTISDEKAGRCIKWEPKAVWAELKTLLSDPRCKARIEHCYTEQPATRYARVER